MRRKSIVRLAPVFLLVLGGVMMAVGIFRHEYEIVFRKAVRICMECIGIG